MPSLAIIPHRIHQHGLMGTTAGMNEAEWKTRKTRIDTRLRALGWLIVPWNGDMELGGLSCHAVTEFPTDNGPADYALFVGGRLLGIIEAKKVTVNPQNVLEQAKRYSQGAINGAGNWHGYRVPFLYATNGEIIWFLDVRSEKPSSRIISRFHVGSAIEEMFGRNLTPSHSWLLDTPVEKIERLRPYQVNCLTVTEAALMAGRRHLFIAMATGTGKTYTTVAQIYRLLQSKTCRRILFLVDRKALAAQAVREFAAFNTSAGNKFNQEYEVFSQRFQKEDFGDDEPFDPKVLPKEYLTNPKSGHAFVYVSTIQRMTINLFGREAAFPQSASDPDREEDAEQLDIPIHAFDLIIADECHRGYSAQETSIWRNTIEYFDAVKIGLTATPAAHTVALFGEPVYRYGVEQAIREGYLVDYDAVAIHSEVRLKGVFVKEGELIGKVDSETGAEVLDHVEDERGFDAEDIERSITAPDSNRKIIQEIATYAYKHEQETGRFPKILIFAVNDLPHTSHADQLVRTCREVFAQGDDFVQKITGNANVDRPLQRIREFRNRPSPKVVVTVDMLSTGVDIPCLEFIVFLRPVKSRILWEQMLGRGTRRCEAINKAKFVVFDCFDGTLIRYFRDVSNFRIEEPRKEPLPLPEVIDNIWQNIDRQYHTNVLVKRLHRIAKDMSGNARTEFAKWIPNGDMTSYANGLSARLRTHFDESMRLLRNPAFQDLLLNYERAKRTFWIAHEKRDAVYSSAIERYGKFEKAEDYLEAFSFFVRTNASKIDALNILLKRPKKWRPQILEELRRTLTQNSFDPIVLQRAHERASHKALADIISIVKRAEQEQAPLLTAQERVDRAMKSLTAGRKFSAEQMKWLTMIAQHLVENLTIAEEDFDLMPVFVQVGGIGKARKIFEGDLPALVEQINFQVAASA